MNAPDRTFGLLAQFDSEQALMDAARRARDAGFRRIDAYTAYPVDGLAEALGVRRTRMPLIVLIGGLFGATLGYVFQYWTTAVDYPINIGGRPLHSWPAFIPVTFEMTILCAALAGVLGMLGINGLPRPHHPLFDVAAFAQATRDGYFLSVEAADPLFDTEDTAKLLREFGAREVTHVAM